MAYASWSVVFGEQPSAAKWNILGTNDASFNDGTGIGDNAIAARSLATNAIKLGYSALTADAASSGTTNTDVAGLATTVTVPSGSRSVLIILSGIIQHNGTSNSNITIWDGAVGGTAIGGILQSSATGGHLYSVGLTILQTPSAGSKTYRVSVQTSTGSTSLRGTASPAAGTPGPSTLTILAI